MTKPFIASLMCVVAMGAGALHAEPATRPAAAASGEALEAQTIAIAPKCVASTVGIVSTLAEGNHFSVSSGSGVIVSTDGLVLTAGHVIQSPGNKLTIRFVDGRVLHGVAVGLDHATDTGLARITDAAPPGGWAFCQMAPDDSAHLGEWVLATGNPGSIVVDRNPPLRLGRVSAHDARVVGSNCALEPGDSGGPLFDLTGRVVGINSRILTSNGNTPMPEYLSLHVPIGEFSRQWKDLLAGMNANPQVNLNSRAERPKPIPGVRAATRAALKQLATQGDAEAIAALAEETKTRKLNVAPALMTRALRLAVQNERAGIIPPPEQREASEDQSSPSDDAPSLASAHLPPILPTTEPATRPASQIGIAAELRGQVGSQLRDDLLRQFPNAIVSDELLSRLMDRAAYDPRSGKVTAAPDARDRREMGLAPESNLREARRDFPGDRASVESRKTSLQTMAVFGTAISSAGDCVVEVRDGNISVLLGTVVDGDGWVVSKASDLPATPRVALPDGRVFRAKVVGKDVATDLALLKVNATGLTAVRWVNAATLGEWVGALTADPNRLAVGVVSLTARPIGETFAHFQGEQKVVLGVGFDGPGTVVTQIIHGMPAEMAGMKAGDEVFELNGQHVGNHDTFITELKKVKAGDTLSIMVRRAGQVLELKPVIGEAKSTAQTASGIGETDNVAGGKLSKRRTNFPLAIQTDTAVWGDECGGPLITLHGEALGMVIARYDRVCTFALPAGVVQATVEKLKMAKEMKAN